MFFFAPADGGPMRQVRLPEEPFDEFAPVLSQDGHHLLYAVADANEEAITLKVLDLQGGDTREVTENLVPDWDSFELSGRGGVHWRDGDEFLYVERQGDRLELWTVPAAGSPRLLHTFHDTFPYMISVYDDRIAYVAGRTVPADEGRSLMLARAGDEQARALLTVRGFLEFATWSPDGSHLTVDTYRLPPGPPSRLELLAFEMDPSGVVLGEPTVLDTPDDVWWWSPRWLPNGRGLLVQGEDGNVWRISSEPGVRPVPITGDLPDNHEVWDFRISPDGGYIAYARSIFQGSSIWRIDLGDALAAAER